VTSTLIAFGKLTCIVHGYNESFDLLSRADSAKRLQDRAETWLLKMVMPLFGAKNTVKVHMLLSHAAEEILDRNDLDFADTSVNEAAHKLEKAAYARTNRQTRGHARQLHTITQSRLLLAAEDGEVAARELRVPDAASDVEEPVIIERDTCKDSDSDESYESDMDGPALPRWDAGIDSLHLGSKGPRGGKRTPLHQIAEWPRFSGAAEALGVPRHGEVNLLSATHFQTVFEWDCTPSTELVRCTEYLSGAPWYDHILYRRDGEPLLAYGYVRLVVDGGTATVPSRCVVVQRLERTDARAGCPFAAAGYTSLRWLFDGELAEWPVLEMVPMAAVARIVHVVPNTDMLSSRFGLSTPNVWNGQQLIDNRDARFLHNILHKSTTPAQQRRQRRRLA